MLDFNLVCLSVIAVVFIMILIFIITYNYKKSSWNSLIADKDNKYNLIEQQLKITINSLNEQKVFSSTQNNKIQELDDQILDLSNQISSLQTAYEKLNQDYSNLQENNKNLNQTIKAKEVEINHKNIEISKLKTNLEHEKNSIQEKIELLQNAKNELTIQFQDISNKILAEKSLKFIEHNKTNINSILDPLKIDLNNFSALVKNTYDKQTEDKGYLKKELEDLKKLNNTLSNNANALTNALTKQNKTQGDWGETALELILEQSGLIKNFQYFTQTNLKDENNISFRPDVIVKLPENKNIIIDAKVSLKHFNNYANATNQEEEKKYLKEHIYSVESHIKDLSKKAYADKLPNGETLDFVLMFIPIEPAYLCVINEKNNLISEYFSKNIIIVTPSNLIAMLKIIHNIWKYENQNKNTLEIAQVGENLYNKLVSFTEDLLSIGKALDNTHKSYTNAMNKLQDGKGNLIQKAEKLKNLGIKTKKNFDKSLINNIKNNDILNTNQIVNK